MAEDLTTVETSELYERLYALQKEIARRNEDGFADGLKQTLSEMGINSDDVRAVVFETDEWDNGWFYENSGTVIFTDGSKVTDVDFESLSDEITELSSDVQPLTSTGQMSVGPHDRYRESR